MKHVNMKARALSFIEKKKKVQGDDRSRLWERET